MRPKSWMNAKAVLAEQVKTNFWLGMSYWLVGRLERQGGKDGRT